MFYYLNGETSVIDNTTIVVDVQGVGYLVNTSFSTISDLGLTDGVKKIYTYVHVREDMFDIYGFLTQDELFCFKSLITVSGVGPKAAISVLSTLKPQSLSGVIARGDYKSLTQAQGIGAKTAQRIVLELKDKLKMDTQEQGDVPQAVEFIDQDGGTRYNEAKKALMVLGYTQAEAAQVLKPLDVEALSVEEVIRRALQQLMR